MTPQQKRNNLRIGAGIAVVLALLLFAITAVKRPTPPPPRNYLEMLDAKGEMTSAFGLSFGKITGHVRNGSNMPYQSVQVQATLYDAQSNNIGTARAYGNNLQPGEVWKFSAPVLKQGATNYRIVKVDGY